MRVSDVVGHTQMSDVLVVWVNSRPSALIRSPIEGSTKFSGESFKLSGEGSSDPDGDALDYTWFLDSSTEPLAIGERTEVRVHPGEYTLTLRVTDDDGAEAHASVKFEVTSTDPSPDDSPIPWWLIVMTPLVFASVAFYIYRKRGRTMDEEVL
jgi:hypothetical protein